MPTLFGLESWTAGELAETLLITAVRISQLTKMGVLPAPVNGRYDAKASVQAYLRFKQSDDASKSKDAVMHRKLELDNALRTLKLGSLNGTLVSVEKVEKDWFQASRQIRDALNNLPARLSGPFAAESNQAKIFDVFSNEIHSVLEDLARGGLDGQKTKSKKQAVGMEPGSGRHARSTSSRQRDRATSRHAGFSRAGHTDDDGEECATDSEDSPEDD